MTASITRSRLRLLITVLLATAWVGCSRSEGEKSIQSDSNGYVCLECKAKFCTDSDVYADKCPECDNVNIETVYGYVCEVDPKFKPPGFKPGCGAVTLGLRGAQVKCQDCGQPVTQFKLPSGEALAQFGAVKASKDKVLIPR